MADAILASAPELTAPAFSTPSKAIIAIHCRPRLLFQMTRLPSISAALSGERSR